MKQLHLTKKQSQAIVGTTGILLAVIAIFVAYKSGRFNPQASINGLSQSVASTAKLQYCSEGEGTDSCNPGAALYSGTAISNTVTTAVEQVAALCFMYKLDGHDTDQAHFDMAIQITANDGSVLAAQTVTGDKEGRAIIAIASTDGFPAGETYTATIKPTGYLARKVSVEAASTKCVTLGDDKTFLYGDLDGDNKIKLTDLGLAIRAYNGEETDASKAAFGGQKPTIANLVKIIRNFNETPQGEE